LASKSAEPQSVPALLKEAEILLASVRDKLAILEMAGCDQHLLEVLKAEIADIEGNIAMLPAAPL
jgi:hypothetical protein